MTDPIELAAIDRGAGPPVALVHGGVFHAAPAWAKNLGPLVDAGYRVIAVDRRGHGRSEPGEADYIPLDLHANDLRLTLELREAPSGHLVGVSYGSLVCLAFALRWPERARSMTLIEPPLFTWLESDPDYAEWFRRFEDIARSRLERSLEDWLEEWLSLMDPKMAESVSPSSPAWRLVEEQAPLVFKEETGWQWEPDLDRLARLDIPTLVVNGSESEPALGAVGDLLTSRMPSASHVWIEGGGHDLHARAPDEFNAALIDFLTKLESPEA